MTQKLGETWISPEEDAYPMGSLRWSRRVGDVRWPDGKIRRVKLSIPDTYFSIPAAGRIRGRYIAGAVMVENAGESTSEYRFYPHPRYQLEGDEN